jgi:curved DNA-binding protein CbpA
MQCLWKLFVFAALSIVASTQSLLFYDLLELDQSADARQIKRAFRKMALKYHPDKATDKEKAQKQFVELVEAYETLSDPSKRRAYDSHPESFHPAPSPTGTKSTPAQTKENYEKAHSKYNRFFQDLERSFTQYVQKQQANGWTSGDDNGFSFDFTQLWDDADEEELNEFSSLYKLHLETHYTAHEKAVREAVRMAKEQQVHAVNGDAGSRALPSKVVDHKEQAKLAHEAAMQQHHAAVAASQSHASALASSNSDETGSSSSSSTSRSEECSNGVCTSIEQTKDCTDDGCIIHTKRCSGDSQCHITINEIPN